MHIVQRKVYDVCVIGSGAAGGFMAKELTRAGAETILLEAGRKAELDELRIHDWPYELPRHGFGFNRQAALYPSDIGPIELHSKDAIGVDRIRTLGGRTVHWNAACLRFSAADFRERWVSGIEEDWPLTYEELASDYSYVEKVIGVCGTRENLQVLPDGEYLSAPPNLRCSEMLARKACRKLGMRLVPTRKALLLQGRDGRGPCHYCGHCMDVCDVGAIFTSANTLIPQAFQTKRLTLRTNALAREILTDREGQVRGVSIVDRKTKKEEEILARIVIVSCSTIESARLLLNSVSPRHPNGLSNSNDVVGRYFHGHSNTNMLGYLKDLVGTAPVNHDGATDHGYITRLERQKGAEHTGGFGVQTQFLNFMHPHHARQVRGYGAAYKQRVRALQPSLLHLGGFAKVMSRKENRVQVNPSRVDEYGIPIPVIDFEFCDNDHALFKDLKSHMRDVLEVAGVELMIGAEGKIGGFASHEVGTIRMGQDAKSSVLNSYCQSREVPNLFVVDGSCFTTFPEKNPTLTIMALAVRSARYLSEEKKKRNL